MSFIGFVNFNDTNISIPKFSRDYQESTFGQSGRLYLKLSWLKSLDFRRYLIILQSSSSNRVQNLSGLIEPKNESFYRESISSDFFFRFTKNLDTPILFSIFHDEKNETLHIARDAFGTIPIFYLFVPNSFVAFSTDIALLTGLRILNPYITLSVSEISAYLTPGLSEAPYSDNTHFSEIKSVLPGQIIEFSKSTVRQRMYLEYDITKYSELGSPEEFGYSFKNLLEKSVTRSIQGIPNVACQLSGGLDSSSISSLIRMIRPNVRIDTYFIQSSTKLGDESSYANEVANSINSHHHILQSAPYGLDNILLATQLYGQPLYGGPGGTSTMLALLNMVNGFGNEVMLTGHDGDSVIGKGKSYLQHLFENNDWETIQLELDFLESLESESLQTETQLLSSKSFSQTSSYRTVENLFITTLKNKSINEAIDLLYKTTKHLRLNPLRILYSIGKRGCLKYLSKRQNIPIDIRSKTLKATIPVNSGAYKVDLLFSNAAQFKYYANLSYQQNIRANEEQFYCSKHFGINLQHPFFDPRLYEFCLSTPEKILYDHGKGRGPLRHAMKGILIDRVRNRTSKGNYSGHVKNSILKDYKMAQDFLKDGSEVWEYVDKAKINFYKKLLESNQDSSNIPIKALFFLNRTIGLAIWLDLYKNRPLR